MVPFWSPLAQLSPDFREKNVTKTRCGGHPWILEPPGMAFESPGSILEPPGSILEPPGSILEPPEPSFGAPRPLFWSLRDRFSTALSESPPPKKSREFRASNCGIRSRKNFARVPCLKLWNSESSKFRASSVPQIVEFGVVKISREFRASNEAFQSRPPSIGLGTHFP